MYRLVCWVGFLSLKEKKFSFRDAGCTTQNPTQTQTVLLTFSPMRLSHNGNLQVMLSETLFAAAKRVRTQIAAARARY
jgi:hypothetical protein